MPIDMKLLLLGVLQMHMYVVRLASDHKRSASFDRLDGHSTGDVRARNSYREALFYLE